MTWQLEKLIKEHDAKLSQADKDAVDRGDREDPRGRQERQPRAIKAAFHELEQASHALSKTL